MPELGLSKAGRPQASPRPSPLKAAGGKAKVSSAAAAQACGPALSMPALAAIRFNVDLKAKHQSLIAAEKTQKVAITAVMRKLIVLANALLKDQRNWTPKSA